MAWLTVLGLVLAFLTYLQTFEATDLAREQVKLQRQQLDLQQRGNAPANEPSNAARPPPKETTATSTTTTTQSQPVTKRAPTVRPDRNQLCWCGSGSKYKHCHARKRR
jgi:preprotein translocase subunit SecA